MLAILLTTPQNKQTCLQNQDFDLDAILAPYQPVKMTAMHFPIDPRLSFAEANQMLAEIRPGKLVTSPLYTHPASRGGDADYGGPTMNGTATMCV